MNVIFQCFESRHQEAVLSLHRSAMAAMLIDIDLSIEELDLLDIEATYINEGGDFRVGVLDGVVVAMGGFKRIDDRSAELKRMRVREDLQGKGIGGRLLDELEMIAVSRGIRAISLETARSRCNTLEFYRQRGYVETGVGTYNGIETVTFMKQLGEPAARPIDETVS